MANKGKASTISKYANIVGRKIDFQIQGRVINLWTTPYHFNPNEVGSMHIILLDDQGVNDGEATNYGGASTEIAVQAPV